MRHLAFVLLLLVVMYLLYPLSTLATDMIITALPDFVAVPPIVIVSNATSIDNASAILHGNITLAGGDNLSRRGFEWGAATGNYTFSWNETGSFGVGEFEHKITELSVETHYFWRALAENEVGINYSEELDFWTTGYPLAPTDFTITQIGTNDITINWTMGVGATLTLIRGSTEGYPETVDDGYLVYNSSGTSVNVTGLSLNFESYYYRTWSWNTYGYSEDYAEANVGATVTTTTILEIAPGLILAVGLCAFAMWKRGWFRILAGLSVMIWGIAAMSYDIKIAAALLAAGLILFILGVMHIIDTKGMEEGEWEI